MPRYTVLGSQKMPRDSRSIKERQWLPKRARVDSLDHVALAVQGAVDIVVEGKKPSKAALAVETRETTQPRKVSSSRKRPFQATEEDGDDYSAPCPPAEAKPIQNDITSPIMSHSSRGFRESDSPPSSPLTSLPTSPEITPPRSDEKTGDRIALIMKLEQQQKLDLEDVRHNYLDVKDGASEKPDVESSHDYIFKSMDKRKMDKRQRDKTLGGGIQKQKVKKQTTLNFGQKQSNCCDTCGMVFNPSDAKDKREHDKIHACYKEKTARRKNGFDLSKNPTTLKFQPEVVEQYLEYQPELRAPTSAAKFLKGDRVTTLNRSDDRRWRKVMDSVTDFVRDELNSPQFDICLTILQKVLPYGRRHNKFAAAERCFSVVPRYQAYMYLRGNIMIGIVIVERIGNARIAELAPNGSSVRRGRKVDADMGIVQIWVALNHRRKGIARTLLEYARLNFLKEEVYLEEMAFSQPTESGIGLAQSYFKGLRRGWSVYDEDDQFDRPDHMSKTAAQT